METIEVFYVVKRIGNQAVVLHDGTHVSTGYHGEDIAKFFDRAHAEEHVAGISANLDTFIESRVESASEQHPAHQVSK